MTLFCQCEMCKEMAKKRKYPLCEYCNEHHDTRLCCPEMRHLIKDKKDKYEPVTLCPFCNRKHDERLHCKEYVKAKLHKKMTSNKPTTPFGKNTAAHYKKFPTNTRKINPQNCEYYIELENEKYTVYLEKTSSDFKALRYGEPWRDLCGDNLIFYLMVELSEAREKITKTINLLDIVGAHCTGETKEAINQLKENKNGSSC